MPDSALQGRRVERALREVTEHFARQLDRRAMQVPDWSEWRWRLARAVAAMHGIAPLLSHGAQHGPAGWVHFLGNQHEHTARRQRRIASLLQCIDAGARAGGIAVVALKGAALHDLGLYAAGERPMADIDLLVRPADAAPLGELLRSMNYDLSGRNWREAVYVPAAGCDPAPFGEHADNAIKIEVHERIVERLAWRTTDLTSDVFPLDAHPGLNPYPSKASLMRHLVLHAAGSMSRQSLRHLQLHDVALLASTMSAADWRALQCEAGAHGSWWVFPPLRLAHRYYPRKIPPAVLAHFAGQCPFWLKWAAARARLYEVSLSYPWVDAFPAMAWAQSPGEWLRYIAQRVRPSKELLAARRHLHVTEHWARHTAWGGLSQRRRILRWAVARRTRPATWHALAAAFA